MDEVDGDRGSGDGGGGSRISRWGLLAAGVAGLAGCLRKEPEIPPEYACFCAASSVEVTVSVSSVRDTSLFDGLVLRLVAGDKIHPADTGVGKGLHRTFFVPPDANIERAELRRANTLLASYRVDHSRSWGGCCEGVLFPDLLIPDSLSSVGGLHVQAKGGV